MNGKFNPEDWNVMEPILYMDPSEGGLKDVGTW